MRRLVVLLLAVVSVGIGVISLAAPTPEQKKELAAFQKEVTAIRTLVTKKQHEEAEKQIEALHLKVEKLITDAQFPPTDKAAGTLRKNIGMIRQQVAKALEKPDPTLISFSKEIAPILNAKCGMCHGEQNPRGQLSLASFAAMKRGGMSGVLLAPKAAARSLIIGRLTTPNDQARMPRNGTMTPAEIGKIALWIDQGALFDGADEAVALASLGKDPPKTVDNTPVVINKATGAETVSFVKDIAPTIVNLCTGCHGANNPRLGLSVVTFEGLMKGSENGRVIVPGNLEGSRLWALVGAGEQPRMPQGQARITRKFHADLQKWIEEGAKFDGGDAKKPIREFVPTEEEMAAEKLAKLTPDEFREMRQTRTEEAWKRVSPRAAAAFITNDEFLVYGDVPEERLKEVSDWATAFSQELRSVLGAKGTPIWKGRLTIFVMKDRFGYSELNQVLLGRSTPRDLHGHALVSAGYEDAYIGVEDVGDAPGDTHGGLQLNVLENLTAAFLRQPGTKLPEWVIRGSGLALASKSVGPNDYIAGMKPLAIESLQGIGGPADVFADDRFGPGDMGPIGFTLVEYMIKNGGAPKFGQFVGRLQSGTAVPAAMSSVYGADINAVGTGYLQSLGTASKRGKAK